MTDSELLTRDAWTLLMSYGMSWIVRPIGEMVAIFVGWNLLAVPLSLPFLSGLGTIGLWILMKLLLPKVVHVHTDDREAVPRCPCSREAD